MDPTQEAGQPLGERVVIDWFAGEVRAFTYGFIGLGMLWLIAAYVAHRVAGGTVDTGRRSKPYVGPDGVLRDYRP